MNILKRTINHFNRKAAIKKREHMGDIVYKNLIDNKKKDDWLILTSHLLGDFCYGMAYVSVFKELHPNDRVIVVAENARKQLLESYTGYDDVIFMDSKSEEYQGIQQLLGVPKYAHKVGGDNRIILTVPWAYNKEKISPWENHKILREYVFGVNENAKIEYATLPLSPVKSIPDFENVKNRIVVINEYSTSMRCSGTFFDRVTKELTASGFTVFSNVLPGQTPAKGAKPLQCSLEELYSIAAQIPFVVSIRSGVIDYLIGSSKETQYFVVYPVQEGNRKGYSKHWHEDFPLSEWQTGNVVECNDEDEDEQFCAFKEWFSRNNRERVK